MSSFLKNVFMSNFKKTFKSCPSILGLSEWCITNSEYNTCTINERDYRNILSKHNCPSWKSEKLSCSLHWNQAKNYVFDQMEFPCNILKIISALSTECQSRSAYQDPHFFIYLMNQSILINKLHHWVHRKLEVHVVLTSHVFSMGLLYL